MKSKRSQVVELTPEEDAFLEKLLGYMQVPNKRMTKIKLRFALLGVYTKWHPDHLAKQAAALGLTDTERQAFLDGIVGTFKVRVPEIIIEQNSMVEEAKRKAYAARTKELYEQVQAVSEATKALATTLRKRDLQTYFNGYYIADDEDSDCGFPLREKYLKWCETFAEIKVTTHDLMLRFKPARGRPSNDALVELVSKLISLYEKLSKKSFTLYRHNEPVTPSHQFVQECIDWFNNIYQIETPYTHTQVYVACEKVQNRPKS